MCFFIFYAWSYRKLFSIFLPQYHTIWHDLYIIESLVAHVRNIIRCTRKKVELTIWGSQQIMKRTDRVAISLLNATSSAVAALCGVGRVAARPACRRQLLRDTLLTAPPPRVIAYRALITAKLQYTNMAHSSVPVNAVYYIISGKILGESDWVGITALPDFNS